MAVKRIDRYTVLVDGHRVSATPDQEARLREMSDEERARFLTVMGVTSVEG
jgi:hypothetical protein